MNAPSSGVQGRSIQSNWMLSFGDLLTLLLCFFLSVLSLSPLNPANENRINVKENQEVIQPKQDQPSVTRSNPGSGTALAKLSTAGGVLTPEQKASDSNMLELLLSQDDFEGLGWDLKAESQLRVKNQVIGTAYPVRRVTIESCFGSVPGSEETAWAGAISRILSLRSQLIDGGLNPNLFAYRPQGPNCNELTQSESESKKVAARLKVEFEDFHG